MSDTVIKVENLSKKYIIGHQSPGGYATFRDAMTAQAKALGRRILHPFNNSTIQQFNDSTTEDFWALKDVSFEIKQGDRVGIIGRNGAGKSTLLKVLSRITEPTSGRITIDGRVASLLEVGTGFHPELTGRENIFLNGAILGMRREEIKRKFDEIVDFAEVEKFLDTPVKRYSSGMYVRLAFAVAAHLEPEILVVDEVLAVGDAQFQKKCLGKMEAVAKEGRTVLFVSHNMAALQSLCDRAICLNSGQIVADGIANEVVTKYLQDGVAARMEQIWDDPQSAPGNDKVRLHRVKVTTDGNPLAELIDIGTPVNLEFEFWNYLAGASLNLSLVLYDQQDICVFNTVSSSRELPTGLIRGVCRIPGNLLNDSTYRVRILIVQDTSVALLDMDNVMMFEVQETEREGNWYGKWAGVIRPQFEWSLKPV